MNTVTAFYVTPEGKTLMVTFKSWACDLLSQYQASRDALNKEFGLSVTYLEVEFRVH